MAKKGFTEQLKALFGFKSIQPDEFWDSLSDSLIEGDLGPAEAYSLVEELSKRCRKEGIKDAEAIRSELKKLFLEPFASLSPAPLSLPPDTLSIFLLLGVNGVGKTTTAAKLASLYGKKGGAHTIFAAGDTFRAAAIEQLKIHGERLDLRVVAHRQGGDSAAVIYDAIETASSHHADLILADTAGRMHTKAGLVEELKKIDRIVAEKSKGANYRKFLVLDVTTGRNALSQAEVFHEAVDISAVILTKYDSTARGGVAYSLAKELSLPVAWVCSGEGYDDIAPFDSEQYVRDFLGLA